MTLCTKGKNETTELKCASFVPIDHIMRVITLNECIIEVKFLLFFLIKIILLFKIKEVYLNFMLHCYLDTDIELKDVNNAEYLNAIIDNIITDMTIVII